MIHQVLLRQAARDSHPVLQEFVETVAPHLQAEFAAVPALGGSGRPAGLQDDHLPAGLSVYSALELERFSAANADQSLATHLLNGLFAGARLAGWLPQDRALTDDELRVWVLGFVVHDYTKVCGIKVEAGRLAEIRQVIARLGERLHFGEFLPDWQTYLDDITFIAQNTQKVAGANLNLRDYPGRRLRPNRLEIVRLLASFADILVHITGPSDVVERGASGRDRSYNLAATLNFLFGADRAPRLAYHRVSEVRGLLTNLLNNTLMDALAEQEYTPYLFFPDGVVYLTHRRDTVELDASQLADRVWERVLEELGTSENFGVRPWTTGFIVSSALYELTGLAGVLAAGRRTAMRLQSAKAATRLYGYFMGLSENDLKRKLGDDRDAIKAECERVAQAQGLPFDIRVDRLGQFLAMTYGLVRDNFRRAPDVTSVLLEELGLRDVITPEEALRQKGGTYFGWFYVGATYLAHHPGLDDSQVEAVLDRVSERVLSWVEAQGLVGRTGKDIAGAVRDYLLQQVEVDGQRLVGDSTTATSVFATELARYTEAKAQRKALCSLCSTVYEAVSQENAEVPFGPQQYSNKSPLATSMIKRGVCPVCRIEMILRRVKQPGIERDELPITLYLYPTYFFTAETATLVRYFITQLEDLNLYGLIFSHLGRQGFAAANVQTYERFMVEPDETPRGISIRRPSSYSDQDPASLFFFTLHPTGKKATETDAWIAPTFYTLALPLLLNVKVVATASFTPLYPSGAEFKETAVLDAPHGFTRHALGQSQFRIDELPAALLRLLRLYELHLDVFAERDNMHWSLINAIVKDVVTDPYHVFAYYERKGRKGEKGDGKAPNTGPTHTDVERYTAIYHTLGGEPHMGMIGEIVDAYAAFYRARFDKRDSAYAVLKPFSEAVDVVVESDPKTEVDDLVLLVEGAVGDLMNRVWDNQADGWDPIVMVKDAEMRREERKALSRQRQAEFAQLVVSRLFQEYCNGDRATLRERTNRLRSAARFYYLSKYGYQKTTEEAHA